MMTLDRVRVIARTELRRRWRALQGNQLQFALTGFFGVLMAIVTMPVLFALFLFGSSVQSGDVEQALTLARVGTVYLLLFATGLTAFRSYSTGLEPDTLDGLLTTVSHRELIWGLVLAEATLWGVPILVFALLGAIAFGAGAQSIVSVPLFVIAAGLLVGLGVPTGFVLALIVKNMGVRSKLLTRLRTVAAAILGLLYFWLVFTQSIGSILNPVFHLLEPTPIGWLGDLVVVAVADDASPGRAVGAVLFSVSSILVSTSLVAVLARWFWYVDPVRVDHSVSESPSQATTVLSGILPETIAGVVYVDWIRARRAPIVLSFAIYPLFILGSPIVTTIQTGTVSRSFPLLVALCGAWITGSLFALNVLGNEGAALPVSVLSVDVGHTLVWGHVLAGALVGVPLTVLTTVALGIASPLSSAVVGTLTLTALVLATAAGPIATGIGTTFPRFEATKVTRSREAIIPSMFAFAGYSITLLIVAAPGLLAQLLGTRLGSTVGLAPAVVSLSGALTTAVVAIGVGWLSLRRGQRTVDQFVLDD